MARRRPTKIIKPPTNTYFARSAAADKSPQGTDNPLQRVGDSNNNQLIGGNGNDSLWGEAGNDSLWGEAGNDQLIGGNDLDQLIGGNGNDTLWGSSGNDSLWGSSGNDQLIGGDDLDQLIGGDGNDTLWGESGNDTLWGESGNDQLIGGDNNDTLQGGYGYDTLWGGSGNDYLYAFGGGTSQEIDVLIGNSGSDTFAIGVSSGLPYQEGNSNDAEDYSFAIISDFSVAEDRIQAYGNSGLYELVYDNWFGNGNQDTGIYSGDDLIAVVQDTTVGNFDQFIFV